MTPHRALVKILAKILAKTLAPFLLLAASLTPALAADESYAIKLSPEQKKGDILNVDVTYDSRLSISTMLPGQLPQERTNNTKAHLQARMEVLEVDKNGAACSVLVSIRKLTDGDDKELLKSGAEVQVKNEKTISATSTSGPPLSDNLQMILGVVLQMRPKDAPTNDDVFGTVDKKKVGESWPAHIDAAIKLGALVYYRFDPSHVRAKSTLKSVDKSGASPLLQVDSEIDMNDDQVQGPDPTERIDKLINHSKFTTIRTNETALNYKQELEGKAEVHSTNLQSKLVTIMTSQTIWTLALEPVKTTSSQPTAPHLPKPTSPAPSPSSSKNP